MKLGKKLLTGVALVAVGQSGIAYAQSAADVVVMRRVLAPKRVQTPTPTPTSTVTPTPTPTSTVTPTPTPTPTNTPTPTPTDIIRTGTWKTSDWSWYDESATCTPNATRIRTVTCADVDGKVLSDSECNDNRPNSTEIVPRYDSCAYQWNASSWGEWTPKCTVEATHTRVVTCQRQADSSVVADELCDASTKPVASEVGQNTAQCEYYWRVSDWSEWQGNCGDISVRHRTVSCANAEGVPGDESNCEGARPADTQQSTVPNSCTFKWSVGDWSDYSSTCTNQSVRERSVKCLGTGGNLVNAVQPDSFCESLGDKPAERVVEENYSGCSFSWESDPSGVWSSTCSANAVQEVSVQCRRSDNLIVDDSYCNQALKPATQKVGNYDSCETQWSVGEWGDYDSTCSNAATRERDVKCLKVGPDFSPIVQQDMNLCDPTTRPVASESTKITSGCNVSWSVSGWDDWSSTCSADATRTRDVKCRQTDGQILPDDQCTIISEKPEAVQTGNYSGCTNQWETGAWGAWTSTCSADATRTRSVVCKSTLGEVQADAACLDAKPPSTQTENYSGCSLTWIAGDWSDWSSTCSDNATRTRNVQCLRGDGTVVQDTTCDMATKPAGQETQAITSSCGFAWDTGEWISPLTCSSSATLTRSVTCRRSDGAAAADSNCTEPKPASTMQGGAYASCTYTWYQSGYTWDNTCSATAKQTQTVYCQRSNGDIVDDSLCSGAKPSETGLTGNFSGCTYDWEFSLWGWNGVDGAWSSYCSTSAKQTRTVQCMRSDGQVATSETSCSGTKPVSNQTSYQSSGCTNKWAEDDTTGIYYSSACNNNQTTVYESYKCVNSSGSEISPTSSQYCGTLLPGPLSSYADNIIPTPTTCQLSNPVAYGTTSTTLNKTGTGLTESSKVASGTLALSGNLNVSATAVQNAALSACLAAAAQNLNMYAPICSYYVSFKNTALTTTYIDWTLRRSNISTVNYGKTGAYCDIYNNGYVFPEAGTDYRTANCGTGYYRQIQYNISVSRSPLSNSLTTAKVLRVKTDAVNDTTPYKTVTWP